MALIRNLTSRVVLADRADVATGMLQRIVGLLGHSSFHEGEALILPRCNAIHTCFMRFPIDALFVKTAQGSRFKAPGTYLEPSASNLEPIFTSATVVKLISHLAPFRIVGAIDADTVIELPIGTIARTKTTVGELLDIT